MGRWNTLPNEILTSIFQNLKYKDLYQCMPVNKNWLTVAQMIMYKDISIDIGFLDEIYNNFMLNTLVNSSFSPGIWVRKITVARIKVPDNVFSMDPKNDPLHLLITHCPLVEEFCFERANYVFEMEWIYLRKVLEEHAGWKLRNIGKYFDASDYLQYYTCALSMRDCLTQFHLKSRFDNSQYKTHFKEFKKIQSIVIGRKVVQDIIQCDPILSSIPTLTDVNVTFYIPPTNQPKAHTHLLKLTDPEVAKHTYPHIKSMQLRDLPLSGDAELVYLISKFTRLDQLFIKFGKGKPWPMSKISIPVLKEFITFISNIPRHTITFRDIDLTTVLVTYYQHRADVEKHALELSITNFLDQSGKSTSLEITNINRAQENLVLGYNLVGQEADNRIAKIKSALFKVGCYLKEIQVTLTGKEPKVKNANTFLSVVFEYCHHVEKVILSGGQLTSAVLSKYPKVAPINNFIFKNTHMDTYALTRLSFYLPYMENFNLENCTFSNFNHEKKYVKISMEATRFGNFTLAFTDIVIPGTVIVDEEFADQINKKTNLVFITVNMTKPKYFCGDPEHGELVHVSRKVYFEDLERYQKLKSEYQTNVFFISVKSMHCLVFKTARKIHRLLC